MATTAIKAQSHLDAMAGALVAKKRPQPAQEARVMTWKEVFVREFHALHVQQQERAFMATTHGSIYLSSGSETTLAH